MAKKWEELEQEEILRHRNNILNAKSFSQVRRENERHKKANLKLSKIYNKEIYEPWKKENPNWSAREIARQRAQRKADVEKARADMESGKTSTLVGKGRDPYAGVAGPLPMYRTPEEAEAAGQSRYMADEAEQYMPSPEYVGKSTEERAAMETSGEFPVVGKYKPTEGRGVEVRRAEPAKRVFKAMLIGDRSKDKVFDTKEEADAYLSSLGQRGAVAEVGGTPQEMARYKEQAVSGQKKEAEMQKIYAQRTAEAKERQDKIREAAEKFDAAETEAERESARKEIESTQRDVIKAQSTRGMGEEQKAKFEAGLAGIYERRQEREAKRAKETEKARAASRGQAFEREREASAKRAESTFQRIIKPLYMASREAKLGRDYVTQSDIERRIERYTEGIPTDPKDRANFFKTQRGLDAIQSIIEDEMRREQERKEAQLRKVNPTQ